MDLIGFIKNKFPIPQYLIVTLLIFISMYVFAGYNDNKIVFSINSILGFLIVFLIFFRIRLFDEIKDFDDDKSFISQFITPKECKKIAMLCIFFEGLFSIIIGFYIFLFYIFVFFYTIIMFYDFFLKTILLKNRVLYNYVHQTFTIIIGLFVFVIYNKSLAKINTLYILFLIFAYFIMGLVEITRKLRSKDHPFYYRSYIYLLKNNHFLIYSISTLFFIMVLSIAFHFLIGSNFVFYFLHLLLFIYVSLITIGYIKKYKNISRNLLQVSYFCYMAVSFLLLIISVFLTKTVEFNLFV